MLVKRVLWVITLKFIPKIYSSWLLISFPFCYIPSMQFKKSSTYIPSFLLLLLPNSWPLLKKWLHPALPLPSVLTCGLKSTRRIHGGPEKPKISKLSTQKQNTVLIFTQLGKKSWNCCQMWDIWMWDPPVAHIWWAWFPVIIEVRRHRDKNTCTRTARWKLLTGVQTQVLCSRFRTAGTSCSFKALWN